MLHAGDGLGCLPSLVVMTPIPAGWQLAARCAELGLARSLFFPTEESGRQSAAPKDEERAAKHCRKCSVQVACLEKSMDLGRDCIGIWGGLGSAKRRTLRRARTRQEVEGYPTHRYTPGCSCSFCTVAGAFLAGEIIEMNTDGARCGYRSSYGRNCRCAACVYVASLNTRRVNTLEAA